MITRVNIDGSAAVKALGIHGRQFPFAVSRAINGTMYEGQAVTRRELPQRFTVRRRTFLEQSIKVKPTSKTNLVGEVGVFPRPRSSIDEALAAQEHGGRRPNPGGGKVAEPLSGARPTPQSITPESKWPGRLKRAFKIKTASGQELILQRIGSSRSRRQAVHGPDPKLKVMYALTAPAILPKRWNFVATVLRIHKTQFAQRMARELANALRTAR